MSLSDAAFAAPRGKAAKATSGKRSAGKHAGGHRHAWHRHGGGRHAKGSRSSRRHAAAAQVEGDNSPVRAVPVPIRQAAPAPVDNGRAVVSIVTGGVASTSARIASDLASALNSDTLRVVPIIGRGTLADLRDLGNSGLGDLALLQSDALANLPRDQREALAARLRYVARLYNEEVHVVRASARHHRSAPARRPQGQHGSGGDPRQR